jgi:hypothetical protein
MPVKVGDPGCVPCYRCRPLSRRYAEKKPGHERSSHRSPTLYPLSYGRKLVHLCWSEDTSRVPTPMRPSEILRERGLGI